MSRKRAVVRRSFMGYALRLVRVAWVSMMLCGAVSTTACGGKSGSYPEAPSGAVATSGAYEGEAAYDMDDAGTTVMSEQAATPTAAEVQLTGPLSGAPAVRGAQDPRFNFAPQPQRAKGGQGASTPKDPPIVDPTPDPNEERRTESARRPMLIYKANLGLAVFKVQENLDTIEKMAVDAGGYMVTRSQNHIKVRVPAEKFQKTIDVIVTLGDVHHRQITADDVTAEFTDLEIRMKNAVVVRDRLQALLAQAKNVEEALQVERELRRLTEEIEVMKGRMKLLSELAAYSTIDVQFSERATRIQSRVHLPFPWLHQMGLENLLAL